MCRDSQVPRVAWATLATKESWETEAFLERKETMVLLVHQVHTRLSKGTLGSRGLKACRDPRVQLGYQGKRDSKVSLAILVQKEKMVFMDIMVSLVLKERRVFLALKDPSDTLDHRGLTVFPAKWVPRGPHPWTMASW